MGSIAERVRSVGGVYVTVRTWLGEEIEAASARLDGRRDVVPVVSRSAGRAPGDRRSP